MTLQQIADLMRDHAARVYAQGGKKTEIMPLVHAETADGQIYPIGIPWGTREEKEIQLQAARNVLKKVGAVRYGIIAEAWAADYSIDEVPDADHMPKHMPCERKDRVEIISIVTADKDGNQYCVAYKIERDANGRPSVGDEFKIGSDVVSTGRMFELLED